MMSLRDGITLLRRQLGVFGDAPFDLGTEVAHEALYRPWRCVAETTDRVALALLADFQQLVDLLDARVADFHALQHTPHPVGAFTTRRALAAALVLIEVGIAGHDAYQVGR